jgi:hypothetical protein
MDEVEAITFYFSFECQTVMTRIDHLYPRTSICVGFRVMYMPFLGEKSFARYIGDDPGKYEQRSGRFVYGCHRLERN